MTCPTCKGAKQTMALCVMRKGGKGGPGLTPCSTCGGSGEVPADYERRVAAGKALREARHAADLTLGDLARRAGILGPADVSGAELGRASLGEIAWLMALVKGGPA